MKIQTIALLAYLLPVPVLGAQANPTTICQTLLAAAPEDVDRVFFDTYRELITKVGEDLLTEGDLQHMIATKKYFELSDSGASPRDHLSAALLRLKEAVWRVEIDQKTLDARIDNFIREQLARRSTQKEAHTVGRSHRRGIQPETRKFQGRTDGTTFEFAMLSPDQRTLIEGRREFPAGCKSLTAWDFATGQEIKLKDETGATINERLYFSSFSRSQDSKSLTVFSAKFMAQQSGAWMPEGDNYVLDLDKRVVTRSSIELRGEPEKPKNVLFQAGQFRIESSALNGPETTLKYKLTFIDESSPTRHDFEMLNRIRPGSIKFAPDLSFFVTSFTYDGRPNEWGIWNTRPFEFRGRATNHGDQDLDFNSLPVISPDSRFIASHGQVFRAQDATFLFQLGKSLDVLAISEDSRWIAASGSPTNEIQIFDLRDGSLRGSFDSPVVGRAFYSIFSHGATSLIYRTSLSHWSDRNWFVLDLSDLQVANP